MKLLRYIKLIKNAVIKLKTNYIVIQNENYVLNCCRSQKKQIVTKLT